MIPKKFVEEITWKTNIVALVGDYVDLTEVGTQMKGVCPFCKSNTFTVSDDKQIYKCFRCGKGGGVISFVQEIEKKTFPAAVEFLADKLNLAVPKTEN